VSKEQTSWRTTLQETYNRGLLCSFREEMRRFHDLNRSHPPSQQHEQVGGFC
jgi:hypothetical protein